MLQLGGIECLLPARAIYISSALARPDDSGHAWLAALNGRSDFPMRVVLITSAVNLDMQLEEATSCQPTPHQLKMVGSIVAIMMLPGLKLLDGEALP